MAKFKISSWIDGINTRINKFRIKESEAVDAVDVDLVVHVMIPSTQEISQELLFASHGR